MGAEYDALPLSGWYPPNGVLQAKVSLNGDGILKLENDGDDDTVFALQKDGELALAVYVRAGERSEVQGIPDGVFEVFQANGRDWSGGEFNVSYGQGLWEEPLPFATDADGSTDIWTLTTGVIDGNTSSEPVSQAGFPEIITFAGVEDISQ